MPVVLDTSVVPGAHRVSSLTKVGVLETMTGVEVIEEAECEVAE